MAQIDTRSLPWRSTYSARRRSPLAWLLACIAVAFIVLLAVAVLRPVQDNPLVLINRPAPAFALSLYSGGTLRLTALRGKTVVVNFWWSGCDPCKQEAAILERQWRAWRNKNVVFVGIDEQDAPAAARQFLETYGITYPNGPDPSDVDIQYHTTGQPESFFVTPRGIIHYKYGMPFSSDAALEQLIREAR